MENKKRNEMIKLLTGDENIQNPHEDLLKILDNPENYDLIAKIVERVISEEEESEKKENKSITIGKLTYGQIVEERNAYYKERLKMIERWEKAGWLVDSPFPTVRLPNREPPYSDYDAPENIEEN